MQIVVGVADMKISNSPGDQIVTYSLGSCIGITIYDPIARVGGMLHYMLPESKIKDGKANSNPYMFADTGIPLLFQQSYKLGAQKSRIIVRVAGGAQVLDNADFFAIGKRNYIILKKILWKNQVLIKSEHVGGYDARTMYLDVDSGKAWLKIKKEMVEL